MVRYNIANYLIKKGQYKQATEILEQVQQICIKGKIIDGVARTYSALAEIAEKTGQLSKAAELCRKAIVLDDSTGRRALKLTLMQQYYEIVKKGGDYHAALILSEEIKMLADSIMNTEKQLEIYKLERQYQADKTELENANLKLQLASQNERLEYRQNFMIVMVIALLVLSFLLFLLYRTFSERAIAYKVLIGQYEEERVNKNSLSANWAMAVLPETSKVGKHEKLNESEQLLGQLQNYFELNKPFLDPKLRVDTVADNLNVTPKAIAAALKGYRDNNFNLFTNRYRVEAAKTLLEDPVGRQYKINIVATKSGFGSKQSFYTAFEQFTGIRPSYYRYHIMGKQEPELKETAEE
jgi:YesN/AraC family two-component response regulator